jgi:PncC family amidohydrolase
MRDKLRVLGLELLNAGLTIGTVEHCTSGLLGASISSMCGLSTVYGGTIVTVDAEHMEKMLEISHNVFKNNGLVSSQTACQMALNGLYKLNTDICVAVVGNVVPPMAADEDPDDTVWICVATLTDKKVDFKYSKINVDGLRGRNIEAAINEALDITIGEIKHITVEE